MENNNIDDIVNMLDNFMGNGGNHMNVESSPEAVGKKVQTSKTNDCGKNMACMVPTLHQGIDDNE